MKKLSVETRMTIQFWVGLGIVAVGLVLLFLGFYAVPIGIINPSVLTAFGEIGTFSGALIGIDYKYQFNRYKYDEENRHRRMEMGKRFDDANKHIDKVEEEYDS